MTTQRFLYECLTGQLPDGRHVLVQIFRDPDEMSVRAAQLSTRTPWTGWGEPIELEPRA